MATVFGVLSSVSMVIVVYLSYLKGGEVPVNYGMTGALAALFSLIGLTLAMAAVREQDRFKLFAWLGMMLNLAALAMISGILYAGSA